MSFTCSSNSKSPLIEKETIISGGVRDAGEVKKVAADEGVGGGTKGKGKAKEVVGEATGSGVKDVGEHDVHGVFGTDRASTKHGKPQLHGEDEVGGEEEVCVVDGVGGGAESGGYGSES